MEIRESAGAPLLVVAEFVFTEAGEAEFLVHRDRTLDECRAIDGCLQAVLWERPGRRYQFSTLWTGTGPVARPVAEQADGQVPGRRRERVPRRGRRRQGQRVRVVHAVAQVGRDEQGVHAVPVHRARSVLLRR